MIKREILTELRKWKDNNRRKPLVLRGARQTGKTTLIKEFGKEFSQFIYLNLELKEDRSPFEQFINIEILLRMLFFKKDASLMKRDDTLIFIDEIQEVPAALNILRYFHEDAGDIAVIAAGSMLESIIDEQISFPVGRVEYKVLKPLSFSEFLGALGENQTLEQYNTIPMGKFAHEKLRGLFHTYALIGGMPEVLAHYAKHRDIVSLGPLYNSLIQSYLEDIEKYAQGTSKGMHLSFALKNSFALAGKRIKFEGFGNSSYRSRDMSEALRMLEKALLVHLIFPCTGVVLPLEQDAKKSPRLHVLDSGLINYFVGIQKEILESSDLNSVYQGKLIEHLVGQELLAHQFESLSKLNFWVREKNSSSAEVDYLLVNDGKVIPIEVKSGKAGKLKSLHQFIDMGPNTFAIRLYAGEIDLKELTTPSGKRFHLLSLPYYLSGKITDYINWLHSA